MSIEQGHASSDAPFIETDLLGYNLLNNPLLNKGTAFTEQERDIFDLHGLLPPNVATLDEQVSRRLQAFRQLPDDFGRYVFLRGLQDTNEVLFYALLVRNLEEMLPIIVMQERRELTLNSLRFGTGNFFREGGNFGAGTGNFTCQKPGFLYTQVRDRHRRRVDRSAASMVLALQIPDQRHHFFRRRALPPADAR